MKKKVVLVGGGTGGHFFCVKAMQEKLSEQGIFSILITDDRCAKFYYSHDHLIDFIVVKTTMMHKHLYKMFLSCMYISFQLIQFVLLFRKVKPDLVVGFGGYTSFVVLLSALILKIPIVLHEQNVILGKVNKIFAKKATKIIYTLGCDKKYLLDKKKIALCKPYVRKQVEDLCLSKHEKLFNNDKKDFTIFITGGSAGAAIFCELMQIVFNNLIKYNISIANISVIHQCAESRVEIMKSFYQSIQLKSYVVKSFFLDIEKCYLAADLVIARAGAGTVSEILFCKKPSILIPLRNSAHNHQDKNAKYVHDLGLAWYVFENEVLFESGYEIAKIIHCCISDTWQLNQKINAIDKWIQLDRAKIHQEILNVINLK